MERVVVKNFARPKEVASLHQQEFVVQFFFYVFLGLVLSAGVYLSVSRDLAFITTEWSPKDVMIGTTEISKAVCFLIFALIWFSSVLFNLKIHGVWRTEKYAEMEMPKVEMLTGI